MTKAITSSLLLKLAHSSQPLDYPAFPKGLAILVMAFWKPSIALEYVCDCGLNMCQSTLLFKIRYSKSNTIISTSKEEKNSFHICLGHGKHVLDIVLRH